MPAPEVIMTRRGTRMDSITSLLAFLLSRCVMATAESELKQSKYNILSLAQTASSHCEK